MPNIAWRGILAAATLLAGIAVQPARALADGAGDPLGLSYVQGNAIYWDIDVAIDRGFFREQGFAPEPVAMQSSTNSVQQLVARAADLSAGSPEPVIDAVEHGATDIGLLVAPTRQISGTLVVQSSIRSAADLKGKTIGVSAMKGGETWFLGKLLAAQGLHKGDYDLLVVGVSPLKYAALQRGSIAGTVLLQPLATVAQAAGYPALLSFGGVEGYPYPAYAVRRSWAHEKGRGVRLARAFVEALAWLDDPANRAAAVAILQHHAKGDPKLLDRVYEEMVVKDRFFDSGAKVDLAGIGRLLGAVKEQGDLKGTPDPKKYMIPAADGGLAIE